VEKGNVPETGIIRKAFTCVANARDQAAIAAYSVKYIITLLTRVISGLPWSVDR
jgi:hypothetical protein